MFPLREFATCLSSFKSSTLVHCLDGTFCCQDGLHLLTTLRDACVPHDLLCWANNHYHGRQHRTRQGSVSSLCTSIRLKDHSGSPQLHGRGRSVARHRDQYNLQQPPAPSSRSGLSISSHTSPARHSRTEPPSCYVLTFCLKMPIWRERRSHLPEDMNERSQAMLSARSI